MATPRRRSARLSNARNQRSPVNKTPRSLPQLDSLVERDETPETAPSIDNVLNTPATQDKVQVQMAQLSKLKTPKTQPRPSLEQMHPQTAHATTTKAPDSGLKMGFADLATGRSPSLASLQNTPSKSQPRQSMSNAYVEPHYQFNFGASTQLSAEAQKMMENVRDEANKIKEQMRAEKLAQEEKDEAADNMFDGMDATGRKIAKPKGKAGRFSDVHMAQFKQMDSIANHPSSFRAQPGYAKPTSQSLKRSPSKAGLDDSEIPRTAGKGTPGRSAPVFTGGRAPTSIKSAAHASSDRLENQSPAKRARKSEYHDVSAGRQQEERVRPSNIPKPVPSSLLSPTKASLARLAATSPDKPSMIPRSHSVKSLRKAYTAAQPSSSEPENVRPISQPTPIVDDVRKANVRTELQKSSHVSAVGIAQPTVPKQGSIASRLPTFSGLKSILRGTRKASAAQPIVERAGTPKRHNTTTSAESAKKVDFTPSVKSRYAVKLAADSPSPVKALHLTPGPNMSPRGPAGPYDPADYMVDHLMEDEDDDEWEDAASEVAYPVLPEPEMGPRASAFNERSKDHTRHESKDFKSIFTDLHHPSRPNTPTLTTVNTTVNKTNPTTHTESLLKSPSRSTSTPTHPPSSSSNNRRSTIRHVRTSTTDPSNSFSYLTPVDPFSDTPIATVPHGLSGKKRRHESILSNDRHGMDDDVKENRRLSTTPAPPGAWDTTTDTNSEDVDEEAERRAGKRVRTSKGDDQRALDIGISASAGAGVGKGSPEKKPQPNKAREQAKENAKGRKGPGKGILSLSRLNMLSRPKGR